MKRAIFDLSSCIWTALLGGKDAEGRAVKTDDGKEVWVNSAAHGYEGAMDYMVSVLDDLHIVPRNTILVIEGKNSKADRQAMWPAYKQGRSKIEDQYVEFNLCKQMVVDAFLGVGAQAVFQDGGVEADDVLGYLATHLQGERYIVSGDKDLAQLVGIDGVHHLRARALDENPFGEFDHRWIPVWIALVGDSGDKISGASGFGKAKGQELFWAFGNDGFEQMEGLIKTKRLDRLAEDIGDLHGEYLDQGGDPKKTNPLCKSLQILIDQAAGVYLSYELGRLRIERVNTMKRPLEWKVGMVKPRTQVEDERLRKWAGAVKLVSAENYAEAVRWAKPHIDRSEDVAFDIETSTPPESDEWLEQLGKSENRIPVDVFGSELTGMSMTFGANSQFTLYLTHEHVEVPGCTNLSIEQMRDFVDLVPREKRMYVHNAAFELPVCFMEWGSDWKDDPLYRGFLRNVRDTAIGSSYVDENRARGLKSLSKAVLGYEQTEYATVTTKEFHAAEWDGEGTELTRTFDEEAGKTIVRVQLKMNQLTAAEVLDYGADDTICTAALASHFRTIMEIEDTWHIYEEVETFPAYLTALAFVQGTEFSHEHMRAMEQDDDAAYDAAWPVLRDYLISVGFDGTVCPTMVPAPAKGAETPDPMEDDEDFDEGPTNEIPYTAKGVKQAHEIIVGRPMEKTQVRTMSKLAKLIRMEAETLDEDEQNRALVFAGHVESGNLLHINHMLQMHFKGEPQLDLASPKKVSRLLYDYMKLPVHIVNNVTEVQRKKFPQMDEAVRRFKQKRAGKSITLSDSDLQWLRKKASGNGTAIDFAVAFDTDIVDGPLRAVLEAIGTMKTVMTRRSLFYKNYWRVKHWKDGKIHASANQCAAVTRRYSYSNPNLQQLPKKGDGVRFRGGFLPHHKDAVVASIDYTGQELRLAAERSQDKNMLACYVGDNLKDIHSITAAGAMRLKWGPAAVKDLFGTYGTDLETDEEGQYSLFVRIHKGTTKSDPINKQADDLRKASKNVNFGAQNGAKAAKLSETLVMSFADAQLFLDARASMFPGVDEAADRAADFAKKNGYALTMMGARRHLRTAIITDENGSADAAARQAWNFEIQGSAGEMVKLGMTRMWKRGLFHRYDVRFIAQVHDELVASVHRDHAAPFLKEKSECMTGPYAKMQVPILASISLGANFADQIECGDIFDAKRISAALGEVFKNEKVAA